MSDITDDIALGGSFGNVGEDQVQTIPTNPVGPEPTDLKSVTNDSSLGSSFGENGSPEAITATSEAAQSAVAAAVSEANAAVSATSAATSATESASSATAAAASASSVNADATAAAASAAAALVSENNAEDSETNASASETSAATDAVSASTSATASATSATSSATSATGAATSEANAATSASSSQTSASNAATSATAASTSETNAETAETNAETAEGNAGVSATSASTSATTAGTSATAAATSASSATVSATTATNQASIAFTNAATAAYEATLSATSATEAATSETNAATSESNAATSETNAATSASSAATSATNAATSETNAVTAETNAASSATAAGTAETNAEAAESNAATSAATATTKASEAVTSASSASNSASTATTKASEASTSATNAATSESNAATSATASATSATNAATSETNAATSETNAATSASSASTSATNAGTSATAAATSETNASSSELAASGSATGAANSATASAASATASSTSATNSAGSAATSLTAQSASEAARDAALAAFDSFDDRYLGQKTSDPTTDNDGNALVAGTLYFNTTSNIMKVYEGTQWVAAYASLSGALIATDNLSDLTDTSAARSNLGLGTIATAASEDYLLSTGGVVTGTIEAPLFEGDLSGAQLFPAKAGEALTKGDALYISGVSGNKPVVMKADANDPAKMPSFGLAGATVSTNANVNCVTYGQIHNVDTTGFSLGDTLYVSTTAGALTATPPAGEASLIQNLGKVERVHASAGALFVAGSGRANATPNLNDGNFFLGNASNQSASADFDDSVVGALSGGSGVSLSASGVIANTAPDQTVVLTGAGTTSVSGTYPNFTITGLGTTYTAGSGLSLTGTTFANTAPDQTVTLTGSGATSISGTYPSFTISSTNTTYSVGDGGLTQINFTSADNTKLDGIEALATADQTASEILTAIKTVDGSGSGLDADLLDGIQGSGYVNTTGSQNIDGIKVFTGTNVTLDNPVNSWKYIRLQSSNSAKWDIGTNESDTGGALQFRVGGGSANTAYVTTAGNYVSDTQGTLWGSSNDGSGSGLDADLLDGLQLHTGRNNEANKVVRTNANGYIDAGWINTTSGDSGIVNDVVRIYCSGDGYLRYLGKSDFKVLMGLPKSTYDRRDSSTNSDYWQGTSGWGAVNMNTAFLTYGSGAIDMWSNPANQPSGTTHWVGQQMVHYSTGSVGHGWQLVMGAGDPALIYARGTWGGGFTSWAKMWNTANDGSGSGLDADLLDGQHGSYYYPKSGGTITGATQITFSGNNYFEINSASSGEAMTRYNNTVSNLWYTGIRSSSQLVGTTGYHIFSSAHGQTSFGITSDGYVKGARAGTFWGSSNDGSGSGLDADLLDGIDSARVVYASGTNAMGASRVGFASLTNSRAGFYDVYNSGTPTTTWYSLVNMPHSSANHGHQIAGSFYSSGDIYNRNNSNTTLGAWAKIWNTANDGSGSGLDADLLDGQQASAFMGSGGGGSPTFTEVYATSWLRNSNANTGLYNQALGAHWYASASNQWNMGGGATHQYLRMRTQHNSTVIGTMHANTSYQHGFLNTSDGWKFFADNSNNFYCYGNITAYYSDGRLKDEQTQLKTGSGLALINQLKVKSFVWNALTETNPAIETGTTEIGLIAQEVEPLIPNAVVINEASNPSSAQIEQAEKDGLPVPEMPDYKTINYDKFIPFLVQAVQDLSAEIKELKQQLLEK